MFRAIQCIFILISLVGCCFYPTHEEDVAPSHSFKWPVEAPPMPELDSQNLMIPKEKQPLDVPAMFDIALTNNPLTKNSWQLARSAAFNVGIAESTLYPTLDWEEIISLNDVTTGLAGGSAIASGTSIGGTTTGGGTTGTAIGTTGIGTSASSAITTGFPTYTQTVVSELSLTWLMLDFGGRSATIEAAKQALFAANWTHNRTIETVMVNVLNSYYAVVNAQGTLQSRELDLKDSWTNLDAAQAQFQAGIKTKLDVLQAQSNYVSTELNVVTARGQVYTTMGQLANALGLPADVKFTVKPLPEKIPLDQVTQSLEQLIAAGKKQRPDLASAFASYLQNVASVTVARSSGLPVFTTNGLLEQINYIHEPRFNGHIYTFNVEMATPVFDGFLTYNKVKQACANAQAAYEQFQNLESTVILDVLTGYYNYLTAAETVKFSEEYLKFSQEGYDVALGSYKSGTGSFLDLLTSQTQLSNARAQLVQARTQLVTSVANLAYATGTL